MKKVVIMVVSGILVLAISTQDKGKVANCDSRVADTKSIIESDMVLLQSLLKEVSDRQKELSQLQLKRDKIKEKVEVSKTVAEWLGLDKEKICGPTVIIPDPYLCTLKKYYDFSKKTGFVVDRVVRCKKGIETGCATIHTFLQIQPHISKIKGGGGGSGSGGFPPISISIPIPIGTTVIGGGSKP